jgi:hypothetical protein
VCTVVSLHRPGHTWPLLLAANRDEMQNRPWQEPARHWPDHPGVVAGRDQEAGGTWLGVNDQGVAAAILNRVGSLGPADDKKSRGILPLLALDQNNANEAAQAVCALDGSDFRPFNMVIADAGGAIWIRWAGVEPDGHPTAQAIPEGLHMLTAFDLDDRVSPRVTRHLPLFRAAPVPDPDQDLWDGWIDRLADRSRDDTNIESGAVLIEAPGGFATVSSSLIALAEEPGRTIWKFAAGAPDKAPFLPVSVDTTACV